jgi:hypothetical protein
MAASGQSASCLSYRRIRPRLKRIRPGIRRLRRLRATVGPLVAGYAPHTNQIALNIQEIATVVNETSGRIGENSRAVRRFAGYSAGRHFMRANRDGPRASGDKAYSGNGSATRSSEPQAENGRVGRKGSTHAATMIMFSCSQ